MMSAPKIWHCISIPFNSIAIQFCAQKNGCPSQRWYCRENFSHLFLYGFAIHSVVVGSIFFLSFNCVIVGQIGQEIDLHFHYADDDGDSDGDGVSKNNNGKRVNCVHNTYIHTFISI